MWAALGSRGHGCGDRVGRDTEAWGWQWGTETLRPPAAPTRPPISLASLAPLLGPGMQRYRAPRSPWGWLQRCQATFCGRGPGSRTQGGCCGCCEAVSGLSHSGLRVGRSLRRSHHKCPDRESQRMGRASSQAGLGNLSCRQALRSLQERSADAPEDHSSCPPAQPGNAMAISSPWVRSSLCNRLEARGRAGGTCDKGRGCSHLPQSGQPLRAPVPRVQVRGGSSRTRVEWLWAARGLPAMFTSSLPTWPFSPMDPRSPGSLSTPQPCMASVLSPSPEPQSKRQPVFATNPSHRPPYPFQKPLS